MADAQIERSTLLAASAENPLAGINAAMQAKADELKEARKNSLNKGREGFRAALGRKENGGSFLSSQTELLKTSFGAGEAKLTATTGKAEITPMKGRMAELSSFNQAKDLLNRSSNVLTYLELTKEKDPDAKLTAIKVGKPLRTELTAANFVALENEVATIIYQDKDFIRMFPELAPPTPQADAETAIKEGILTDPQFKANLEDRMSKIQEEAIELPDVSPLETQLLMNQRNEADINKNNKIDELAASTGKSRVDILHIINAATDSTNAENEMLTLVGGPLHPDQKKTIKEAYEVSQNLKKIDGELALKGPAAEAKHTREVNIRLQKEAQLMGKLENILGDALADTMEKRYDDMAPLEIARAEKEAKNTQNKDVATVGQKMQENWVKYDPATRKKETDVKQIKSDLDLLIYQGDTGLKRLLLRDMGAPWTTTYDTIDLTTLTPEENARLEAVKKAHGEAYSKKLLKDFYMSRNMKDKLDRGLFQDKLGNGIKKHEWALLQQNFDLEKIFNSTKSTDAAVQKLLGQVNLDKPFWKDPKNLKWLPLLAPFALASMGLFGVSIFGAASGAAPIAGGFINNIGKGVVGSTP